ncbi:MAG: DUF928 domain-containing protein [Desulfococcaceae bacterium]|jgi:hypothetical protein|nr:DUF928 domain-containing protein [Desulfococcaceae bacterium]
MHNKNIFRARISPITKTGLKVCLMLRLCIPFANADTGQTGELPLYRPPVTEGEILRREGGNIGVSRGFSRELLRDLTRNMTGGFTRSLMRGEERSLMRGEERSLFRSLMRGEERSLFRADRGSKELQTDTGSEVFPNIPIPEIMAPLADLRTGYTANPQPLLFWYVSGPWRGKIEFTLNEIGKSEPVLQRYEDRPPAEGIYGISLADCGITLRPDTDYEWFVAIVPFPKERSADFLGSAVIRYVPPPETFTDDLRRRPDEEQFRIFARAGYWYDTVACLCRMIEQHPGDPVLRQYRADLLEQAELGKVTDYDRKYSE